jgi:serine/threonine protein kinase/tetratricopeptide (TPR) repeat protein
MSLVFISYRRDDSPDAVARIHERLVARLRNREVFYDHTSIELGDEFPQVLRDKVTTAGVVLVVIGPRWVASLHARRAAPVDHVREEVRLALASGADVVPVLVGRATMPTDADLADFPDLLPLLRRNAQPVPPDPLFESECDKLLAYLERTGPADVVGSVLAGKYKVQRQIGEGGMGDVYVAEQTHPVRRLVAVKLIKPGMESKDVLARFDAERQALAVMDHPNVCQVLDAGTAPNGRPFFVMEYVKGVPITQFCDDRKLTPRERLDLFVTVCRGVQHAHQKGIIHRDIKPGNVLVEVVDGKPVPKVIDFGLAKALGRTLTDKSFAPTEYGRWVGTLEYSSPEQAEGRFDIDTLSDVYSLGVLLYELLAGSPPFTRAELRHAGEEEMRRVIREVEPSRPSHRLSSSKNLPAIAANRQLDPAALGRALRGELDWIILKALDKAPERRYATPTALADDLTRHLTDQPVSAGKPSAWLRLRKFYRRNRVQVVAAGLVVSALVLGVVGTTLGLLESERLKALAEANAQSARDEAAESARQKNLAEQARQATADQLEKTRQAEELAKAKTKEVEATLVVVRERTRLLSDAYGDFVFGIQTKLENNPGTQELRKQLLETARAGLKKVLDDARRQGTPDSTLVWSHFRMGDVELALGNTPAAEKEYQAGYELAQRLADADPKSAQAQRDLSVSFTKLGDVALQLGRTNDALDYYKKGLDVRQRLADADPKSAQAQRDLLVSHYKLGMLSEKNEDYAAAIQSYEKGLAVAEKFAKPDFFEKEVKVLKEQIAECKAKQKEK